MSTVEVCNARFYYKDSRIKLVNLKAGDVVHNKDEIDYICLRCGETTKKRKLEYVENDLKAGRPACKNCSGHFYYYEEMCRHILKQYLRKDFIKGRHDWLKDAESSPLELDGFCESEKLAFEYQGEQHSHAYGRFTRDDVARIQKRDQFKLSKCEEKGITLLVIEPPTKKEDLTQQIKRLLGEKNIVLRSEAVSFEGFLLGTGATAAQRAEVHAHNKGYRLERPDPLTDVDEDFKFFCDKNGHDQPIFAKKITLSKGRPSCRSCGHVERASKQKKSPLSPEELNDALKKCSPILTLEKWAGRNDKGEHLCRCSDASCRYVWCYSEDEITNGAGDNICWGCKPKSKKRRQIFEVLEKVFTLGGTCKDYSSSMEPISKTTSLTFSCFNSEHGDFSLTIGQILDDQWCTASPCDERRKKKAVVGSEEIYEYIVTNFQGVRFENKDARPKPKQDSALDIYCEGCGHELKNRNGKKFSYKSLKNRKDSSKFKCDKCSRGLVTDP